jgi:hypothetical protein
MSTAQAIVFLILCNVEHKLHFMIYIMLIVVSRPCYINLFTFMACCITFIMLMACILSAGRVFFSPPVIVSVAFHVKETLAV